MKTPFPDQVELNKAAKTRSGRLVLQKFHDDARALLERFKHENCEMSNQLRAYVDRVRIALGEVDA